ncbi:response regulator transcription factor [Methylococcus sp. EFPC2]|uniref:response regulator transcription factor n=1 Tax=Methylococcus sp. EFPC2 TaxID=2812648 RepID=UPI001968475F|nr:response regulator [Methylococcus sp. EFPC2]QSA96690.1 response regulator transcription factor [Methylococcus sp. EFPC2]
MKKLRIAIIDDDASVRDGLATLLEAQGHAPTLFGNTESFRATAGPGEFDCILLDLWFREGGNGIDLLRYFLDSGLTTPVIMMSREADIESAFRAGELGAVSYLPKPIRSLQLADALTKARARLTRLPQATHRSADAARLKLERLTATERRVLDRLVQDLPNKKIADEFGVSTRTVETHRAHIIEKLGTHSKIEMREMLAAAGELAI